MIKTIHFSFAKAENWIRKNKEKTSQKFDLEWGEEQRTKKEREGKCYKSNVSSKIKGKP
jgi:hypothetical protein